MKRASQAEREGSEPLKQGNLLRLNSFGENYTPSPPTSQPHKDAKRRAADSMQKSVLRTACEPALAQLGMKGRAHSWSQEAHTIQMVLRFENIQECQKPRRLQSLRAFCIDNKPPNTCRGKEMTWL